MTTIGFMGPAIALIGMSFVGCNPIMTAVLLCLGVMLDGVGYAGIYAKEISQNISKEMS